MIACFLRSQDIYKDFEEKYSNSEGIISKKKKNPHLLAVTTSSSMGRSSVYNRLKLNGTIYMHPIEYTKGWGHFHIPDELFNDLRDFLRIKKHSYADGHKFGQGANWKFRLTKTALNKLGMGSIALKHGIKRQVFISYLAENSKTILKNGIGEPDLSALLSINEISQLALDRWIIKRAERMPDYKKWTTKNLLDFWQN
jgi:hypothetical protein